MQQSGRQATELLFEEFLVQVLKCGFITGNNLTQPIL